MPNEEWVEMTHPELGEESTSPDGGPALVTQQAYDEVWADKGWKLVEKPKPKAASKSASDSTGGK